MRLTTILMVLWLMTPVLSAQDTASRSVGDDACSSWYSKVDPRIHTTDSHPNAGGEQDLNKTVLRMYAGQQNDPDDVKALTDEQAMIAIDCLLKLEGNTRPSRFGGPTRLEVSQLFATAPVNLAALYYISYLYTQNWQHAGAVALRGESASSSDARGMYVTKRHAIRAAYKSYRQWFARVKEIGLEQARKSRLSPLEGTGLEWYGPPS